MNPKVTAYFERFGLCERQIASAPNSDLGMALVIPCFNEPRLLDTLKSVSKCERPQCVVEVIVVINSSANASPSVLKQNRTTFDEAVAWRKDNSDARLELHVLNCANLPPKHAGVGLARKTGMDEAVRRLDEAGNFETGVIVGLDADCTCATNYLTEIEAHFAAHPYTPGCSIHFEHPLSGDEAPEVYDAAAAYELHLRYYVEALRYARFPHAFHTVGSCMAVRARAYVEQGGMNKRQAGEDFYFLHKVIALGGFTELSTTTVFPSPRASDRVPFGTGKAVGDCLRGEEIRTYPIEAFTDIRAFLESMDGKNPIPQHVKAFLDDEGFAAALDEIRRNTTTPAAFRKRLFRWFDGFMAMKLIHYLRDRHYGDGSVADEARRLLELKGRKADGESSVRELLDEYRHIHRGGCVPRSSGVRNDKVGD